MTARLLVTGGGSGIGREACRAAAAAGLPVVALDRDPDGLALTAEQTGAGTLACDVTDEAAVAAALDRAAELLGGPPDGLVSAAGVYRIRPALEIDAEAFTDVLRINTVGSFLVARETARRLVQAGRPGAMVLLASIAHESGDLREPAAHYAASKGAVVSLVRQLAVEWAPHGIRVNAVSPGVIRTPMLRLTGDPQAARAYLDSAVPLRRLGEPEEIAAACLYLLGDGASYVTGTVLTVDGGSMA